MSPCGLSCMHGGGTFVRGWPAHLASAARRNASFARFLRAASHWTRAAAGRRVSARTAFPLRVCACQAMSRTAVERYRGIPPDAETRQYELRILAAIGGQLSHPFDPAVTPPSQVLSQVRRAERTR